MSKPECRSLLMLLPCTSSPVSEIHIARLSTTPPSTRNAAPVVADDNGEARYATRLATSSTSATRWMIEVGRALLQDFFQRQKLGQHVAEGFFRRDGKDSPQEDSARQRARVGKQARGEAAVGFMRTDAKPSHNGGTLACRSPRSPFNLPTKEAHHALEIARIATAAGSAVR